MSRFNSNKAQSLPALNPGERPAMSAQPQPRFGSDEIAATLQALDIPFIALNPGASYRGLHDSLVNFLGNTAPQMILCLHEEHAVAIGHGYAKVTGKAMAVAVHANVGLMHATMAVFNAWCDRMPLLLLGATGYLDAAKRRPWIEWIHTARDQGALVRDYTKWDDQPASPQAARESLLRGRWLSEAHPKAPVYVNLDVDVQEQTLERPLSALDVAHYQPVIQGEPGSQQVVGLARLLDQSRKPVILAGRVSRNEQAWTQRIALAETFNARVITDLKVGAAFPTDHPLHAGAPGIYADAQALQAIREADLIISLDWVDLAGLQQAAFNGQRPDGQVVQVSLDHTLHRGWSMDYQGFPVADHYIAADPDALINALAQHLEQQGVLKTVAPATPPSSGPVTPLPTSSASSCVSMAELAYALQQALNGKSASLTHLPLGWDGALWPFRHPLDFLGSDGGGGIGGGPGISVGAALALRDSGRTPIAICGDGDFLMGATALWTAVHYRIPLLVIVANNQSFFNDEVHQERVARARERPVENKWIGQRMDDPAVDIAGMARAQGALAQGPVTNLTDLQQACVDALKHVHAGGVAVIDVHVQAGYTPAMTASLQQENEKESA